MRFLFCCEFYHPSVGGVQEVMRQIAERLVRFGHEVTVATTRLPERSFTEFNGVRVVGFDVAGNRVRGLRGEVERYQDFVTKFGSDAILVKAAQQWTFDALWPVLDRIRARKVFIPCGFAGLYRPDFADYYRAMPQVLRRFDHLIFYAQRYRDTDFAREHGIANFTVIPNGASEVEFGEPIDGTAIRASLGIDQDAFVFLTVGAQVRGKGHGEIAEAFARCETGGRKATLVINGNRPINASSIKAVARPDVLSRLKHVASAPIRVARRDGVIGLARRLVGRRAAQKSAAPADPVAYWIERVAHDPLKQVLRLDLPRAELVELFAAADLFVFASHVEYSPLVLFETVAAGTPFLSVPVGNAEEIASLTGGGRICPANVDREGYTRVDPAMLAQAMSAAMLDADELARVGRDAREVWSNRFSWNVIARHYEAVLTGEKHLPVVEGPACHPQ